MHTTNYFNTFISVAEDCPVDCGTEPPLRGGKKTIAGLQYELLVESPYEHTSDELFFEVYAMRKNISEADRQQAREDYFSKGQPCFRASPLTKKYGWGVHSDGEGRVAIYGCETREYRAFQEDRNLRQTKAMRSSR